MRPRERRQPRRVRRLGPLRLAQGEPETRADRGDQVEETGGLAGLGHRRDGLSGAGVLDEDVDADLRIARGPVRKTRTSRPRPRRRPQPDEVARATPAERLPGRSSARSRRKRSAVSTGINRYEDPGASSAWTISESAVAIQSRSARLDTFRNPRTEIVGREPAVAVCFRLAADRHIAMAATVARPRIPATASARGLGRRDSGGTDPSIGATAGGGANAGAGRPSRATGVTEAGARRRRPSRPDARHR